MKKKYLLALNTLFLFTKILVLFMPFIILKFWQDQSTFNGFQLISMFLDRLFYRMHEWSFYIFISTIIVPILISFFNYITIKNNIYKLILLALFYCINFYYLVNETKIATIGLYFWNIILFFEFIINFISFIIAKRKCDRKL